MILCIIVIINCNDMEYLSRNAILYDDNHKFIKKRNFSFQETPGM